MADLTEELTAIAGVEGADVSVSGAGVTGVKVRLETDADADGVGRAVQEVMSRHGVKARLGTTPPPPPSPLVALPDFPVPEDPIAATVASVATVVEATIAGVAVTETSKGLEVSVTASDGRIASQRCRGGEEPLAEAVAIATAELFGNRSATLLEYRREHIAETEVVTVVMDAGTGGRMAGAAVMGAGFAFAVARAVAAALGA